MLTVTQPPGSIDIKNILWEWSNKYNKHVQSGDIPDRFAAVRCHQKRRWWTEELTRSRSSSPLIPRCLPLLHLSVWRSAGKVLSRKIFRTVIVHVIDIEERVVAYAKLMFFLSSLLRILWDLWQLYYHLKIEFYLHSKLSTSMLVSIFISESDKAASSITFGLKLSSTWKW